MRHTASATDRLRVGNTLVRTEHETRIKKRYGMALDSHAQIGLNLFHQQLGIERLLEPVIDATRTDPETDIVGADTGDGENPQRRQIGRGSLNSLELGQHCPPQLTEIYLACPIV